MIPHTSVSSRPCRLRRLLCLGVSLLLMMPVLTMASCHSVEDKEASVSAATDTQTLVEDTLAPEQETQPVMTIHPGETVPEAPPTPGPEVDMTPRFSHLGGLYDADITLSLSLPEAAPEDTVIRYTTNGAVPTSRDTAYRKEIPIAVGTPNQGTGGMVIRAACFNRAGERLGAVVTHTYIPVKDCQRTVYTVMISAAEADLQAMYARYNQKIERPAHVEIVTPEGKTVLSQDAGLRLFGGSSRSLEQKSFKLIARKQGYFGEEAAYTGKGSFAYPLFPERTVLSGAGAGQVLDRYDSFILRNGGNDSLLHTAVDPTNATLLRDGVVNQFARVHAPHVDASLSHFAAVYLNGRFYGLLDMRENQNEDYVKRIYGVDDTHVVVVKSELDTNRHCAVHSHGGACRFDNVWFYLETDPDQTSQDALRAWQTLCREAGEGMSLEGEAFRTLFQEVTAQVDLQSFLEYMALGMYTCNTDWPHNNVKLWKYTGEPVEGIPVTDGKWRFMTRDMDMALGRYASPYILPELDNRATVDTFWRTLGHYVEGYRALYEDEGETRLYPDSLGLQGLLAFCLKDADFRASFASFARTLATEQAQADLTAAYKSAMVQADPFMSAHIQRWGITTTYRQWQTACRQVALFIDKRPAYFLSYLDTAMGMYED